MPGETSAEILKRLYSYHPQVIDLSLREGYFRLLEKLGNPHRKLPPTIHVAGTNGKGSTIAFLRAMLEAAGKSVHVYTSPNLVTFHERFRIAGKLIGEEQLVELLLECEKANAGGAVTFFELTTAVGFLAFSRTPADVLLLEVGMGGRLDSTNVIQHPALSVITRISHDHAEYLGDTLVKIAGEKAGIFKTGVPAVIGPQDSDEVVQVFVEKAEKTRTPLFIHDKGWRYALTGNGFTFLSSHLTQHFPEPALLGEHQIANAATAIAALTQLPAWAISVEGMTRGLREVEWPARLQHLRSGPLVEKLNAGSELWLDGGHNDTAGLALAHQAEDWQEEDAKPLMLIYGMLSTKQPEVFLKPLAPYLACVAGVEIPGESKSLSPDQATEAARASGVKNTLACADLSAALDYCLQQAEGKPVRILIAGSLYLAGTVLRDHG